MVELNDKQKEQLKKIQIDMLEKFISVCETLNLEYYVIAGTLLGAVRHQGFIPWDDDIDVAMSRADYEVFVEKGQDLLPKDYFVQTFKTDPNVPFNFCKLRNSNTTMVERSIKNFKVNHGVGLDIFPLDYYPETKVKSFQRKKLLLSRIISKKFYCPQLSFLGKVKRVLARILFAPYSIRKAVQKREKLYTSVKDSNYLSNLNGIYGKREVVPKKWLDEVVLLDFEHLKVKAFKEYDLYLKQVYGDYMQLPPIEEREGHHYAEIVDLETSYKEYT